MSTIQIRSQATDNYTILSNYDSSANLEPAIVQSLVQSAYNYNTINMNLAGDYISPVNDSSWNVAELDNDYITSSAISNYPNSTVTEYSVISTKLEQNDVSVNSYTTNISSIQCNNNTYTFQDLSSSAPYYDSTYVVTQSLIADCSDNVDGNFVTATFDINAANAKIQYAMQSRWNTVLGPYPNGLADVGPDPTAMSQDVTYNTEKAFAMQGTGQTDASYQSYWVSVNPADGSLVYNLIDASYQPHNNNLVVTDRDMSGVTLNYNDDVGIFRIQQPSNIISTRVSLNDSSYQDITTTDLNNMPLFNGYGGNGTIIYNSLKTQLPIPGEMTNIQFQTLINSAVYDTVTDQWAFQIDIESTNGGYTIAGNHPLMSDLDDSNLLDNPYYMENYVSNDHTIEYSAATVVVNTNTAGQQAVVNLVSVDLSSGETLPNNFAGVDGQFILNSNVITERYTDLSVNDVSGVTPLVVYSDGTDTLNGYTSTLSEEEMTNWYLKGGWQKIAQDSSTTSSDYYLNKSNNALLTLYTSTQGIVDNSYNDYDFSFNFNNNYFGQSEDIRLWKIDIFNNVILNPQSFYSDFSYNTKILGINTSGIITNLTESINYNSYRLMLTAKTNEDINLYNAVQDVSGWVIEYENGVDTFLHSSSDRAYSEGVGVPVYSAEIVNAIELGTDISFTYVYKTVGSATSPGALVDSVDIIYDYNNNTTTTTISQADITRVYDESFSNLSYIVVPDSSYTFISPLNKTNYELVYVDRNSRFNASFNANYGPFTNIKLTVENILQNDLYYSVRNKSTNELLPPVSLSLVNSTSIPNITTINETILPSEGNSLSIHGFFSKNDLKPFYSVAQGEISNDTWEDIGNTVNMDVYYGITTLDTLMPNASLQCNIEFMGMGFNGNTIVEVTNVNLVNVNYYVPMTFDLSGNNFALSSFRAITTNDISNNTDLKSTGFNNNTNYLTLTNGYSNVTNWDNEQYQLTYSYDSSINSLLTISDLSSNVIFTIRLLNNTIFLGDFYISYIPRDYYRVERLLGSSDSSNDYLEEFISTDYASGTVVLSPVLEGIYLQNGGTAPLNSNLDSASINLGAYSSFRVLGDFMDFNPIGTAQLPNLSNELGNNYNSGSLLFQHNNLTNYSAAFTFSRYRGYYSYYTTVINQYYDITRDQTEVTFRVAGAGALTDITDTLTSNMYYLENFNVSNLRNSSNELVANLNLTGTFNYSIPPSGSLLTYDVNVVGDSIAVSINNPKYMGDASNILVDPSSTPVIDPKSYSDYMTLKDYGRDNLYTFSGTWFLTQNLMAIRPSRVKLNNTAYSYDSLSYKISVETPLTPLYKAIIKEPSYYNWIGDPQIHDVQDPNLDISLNFLWELHSTYDISAMILDGIPIGRKRIFQNMVLSNGDKLAYIISTPPYYKFEQISTANCPEIPYDYSNDYSLNRTNIYMPFIDTSGDLMSVFNPFATSTIYTDINETVVNVQNNSDIINDVTFTLVGEPTTISQANLSPDNTRYGIIVQGTNVQVDLYLGLYNSTTAGAGHTNPIWNGPITSIPSTPNITGNALIFRNREPSGGITFSALQYPGDVGYSQNATSYEYLLKTNVPSNWYNVDFRIGNTSWFNNNSPVTYFDMDANGIRPTLYTVVDVNNYLYKKNVRRVYKYTSISSIDIDTSNTLLSGYQTFNITFNSREYCDFDISMNTTFPSSVQTIWKYNDLLNQTVIPNSSITWTVDASFNGPVYVSWSFGNSTVSKNMLIELFGVQDTQNKWVYLHLEPFMRYMNQFNLQVGSISWDGSVVAPLVSTRTLVLAPEVIDPILPNDTYAAQEYSESTLLDYNNGAV